MSSFSKKRVLEILDQAQEGDNFSKLIDRCLGGLIVLNILAVSLESIESVSTTYRQEFLYFEYFSVLIFASEYLLRIWASAERHASRFTSGTGRRLEYIFSFNGLIDLLAILPSIISFFVGNIDAIFSSLCFKIVICKNIKYYTIKLIHPYIQRLEQNLRY